MKKLGLILGCIILSSLASFGQYIPNAFSYQAVARDADGKEISNSSLTVHLSILKGGPNGDVEWLEEDQVTTNRFGLFSINIGEGTKKGGTAANVASISWGSDSHYLKVEVDFGKGFVHMGTTQMMSVPYALYAAKAANAETGLKTFSFDPVTSTLKANELAVDLTPLKPVPQNLQYDPVNMHLTLSGSSSIIDFRTIMHNPQDLRFSNDKLWMTGTKDSTIVDLSSYKQTLTLTTNGKIAISNGNAVSIDTSSVNEIQDLTLTENTLKVTKNASATAIDLTKYLDNTDKQTLSLTTNGKIAISNGNAVSIDTSSVNEIQDLTLTGNTLKVTKNANATAIDLTKYLDDTDKQTLSRNGNNLTISGGNSVDVTDMVNLPWAGFSSNNLTGQALPSTTESLVTWNEEFDSGNVLDNNKFIAPATGFYNLSFSIILSSQSNLSIKVYKGSTAIRSFDSFGSSFSHTMLLNLNQGETVAIKITNSAGFTQFVASGYFSGYRVN